MSTVKEAVKRIQRAGVANTRIVPMLGSQRVKIEALLDGSWVTVAKDLDQKIAEDIIRQSTSRVILG